MDINLFAQRLQALRISKGLSQKELAFKLSELKNGTESISTITISSYERGQRMPTVNTLVTMSYFFNTSLDYLVGLDSIPEIKKGIRKNVEIVESDTPVQQPEMFINVKDWKNYNDNPVFVVAPSSKNFQSRWGMLDFDRRRIIFTDVILPLSTDLKLYRHKPLDALYIDVAFKKPLSLARLAQCEEPVWVEMVGGEDYIKGKYQGWYKHNEDRSCLINTANGLTLPYQGCSISYNAYTV